MSKTTWTVEHDRTLGQIRIVIESTDPAMVRRVEAAARRNGITLLRDAENLPGDDDGLEAAPLD